MIEIKEQEGYGDRSLCDSIDVVARNIPLDISKGILKKTPSCLGHCASRKFYEIGEYRFNVTDNLCRKQILEMLTEVISDTMQVFDFGATKHPDSGETPNFLTENGNKCSRRVRGNSCLHHAAEVRAGETQDPESKLHPALHLIASAAILYIRQKRNILHPEDKRVCDESEQTT